MSHNNPFAQGGWKTPDNHALWDNSSSTPSIFGALPYPTAPPPHCDFITYHFTSFNPSLLNCTVVGPNYQPYYHIVSDANLPGYTACKNVTGRILALIEWKNHPLVELRDILNKQGVRDWLKLSPDNSHRTMDVRGIRYMWAPYDKFICLYDTNQLLARISKGHGTVSLEMTTKAIELGLLGAAIVATVLLQCGRNID